jgi:hypothetical protein
MKKKELLGSVLEEEQLPTNPAYYDRLHDKIMARVAETEMQPPQGPAARSFEKSARLLRDHWRGWLYSRES